jgi:hypothetical protein
MQDRRFETRMLCADLIDVWWTDESGRRAKALANLEDISSSGACLQIDVPVAAGATVHICHPKVELEGRVRYCVFREIGYFVGVEFTPGFHWDAQLFQPEHLLDPRTLLGLERRQPAKFPPGKVQ